MVEIIGCESGFAHYKSDGDVLTGRVDPRDTGVAQINTGYHPGVEVEDFWENISYARRLYNAQGTQPWVCRTHVAQR